jgi:mannose-6-phosphate isomerase
LQFDLDGLASVRLEYPTDLGYLKSVDAVQPPGLSSGATPPGETIRRPEKKYNPQEDETRGPIMPVYRLDNVIQPYAWGSKTAIADLVGQPSPSAEPQAELWMGTHPKGPSRVAVDGQWIPLAALIAEHPAQVLGEGVVRRFGPHLPFLFKVLAAAAPLSIQAHPDKRQAEIGFARENAMGMPMDGPHRNYRDPNHKPEILCALTPFWALNGFRRPADAADLLVPVCPESLRPALKLLDDGGDRGLRRFFETMMTLDEDRRMDAAGQVRDLAEKQGGRNPVYRWMVRLAAAYPGDMGVLAPALLNLITLLPGQAIYLPAGQMHAYLEGVGIELMANSDNVLRGGLTPKHVDLPELLNVVHFNGVPVTILDAESDGTGARVFRSAAAEFELSMIRCDDGHPYRATGRQSVEILLCTAGSGRLTTPSGEITAIEKGAALLVPAAIDDYGIDGRMTLYRAAVPTA